jgi:type I restriction enzyme S subunit
VTGRLVSRKTTPKQSAIRRSELSETSWGKFAPPDWSLTTLADSCLKISDGTHKTPNYRETGVPFLSIKDISGGKIDFSRTRYISQAEHDELCKRIKPSRGDVLFCRIGTLGRAITIETDQVFSIFVSLGLLRPKPVLNPKYLEIALNSPISHKQFDSIKAGGSHTQKLNLVAMSKYIVWYPDLDTQSEIVNRVTSLMQLCDRIESELKKREVITKNFAQSVLSV